MTQPHATDFGRPVERAPVTEPGEDVRHDEAAHAHAEASHAVGWIVFAAFVLALVGALNAIYGTAAISGSKFYGPNTDYVLGSLEVYGWLMLVIGAVQFFAAVGVLAFAQWARWVGVASAAVNGIVQLLVMPAAPFMALALLAMDVLVVYGLVVYGQRWRET